MYQKTGICLQTAVIRYTQYVGLLFKSINVALWKNSAAVSVT